MPTVLRIGPYRFFFYADERQEPPHIHVVAAEKEAKYWLTPIHLSWNDGFRSGELKSVEDIIEANLELFLEVWHGFFHS
ncbi:DUF4160 domain-containing protein [Granulicella sp. 5B5]|uniref:DUF4160 domain-containing protein n=1 Tax=Granulicella sp. 5B5 TaxID=1617967 RepID=UPI0015F45931|nr:DUF4160 domain-containing protein [Granulicella sp. 5B5]QMV18656.1 DUF4160 domain-containing protein [Granulicella sp. 5B5]